MNDVQFVEAARKFAERIMLEGGADENAKATFAFRSIVARFPNENEHRALTNMYAEYLAEFKNEAGAAESLLKAGESPRNEQLNVNELAAWTIVAHLIFNLSETVTKG
ncbi:MAG: hypothetical protein VX257_08320, partial [Planctomycetota bacterium]|nr:hypothetical protein [Planctomycetota bacterium]